jgi:hypothetical protein
MSSWVVCISSSHVGGSGRGGGVGSSEEMRVAVFLIKSRFAVVGGVSCRALWMAR